MASNQRAMASNPIAMTSNLIAMTSNLIAMAPNLVAMDSNLEGTIAGQHRFTLNYRFLNTSGAEAEQSIGTEPRH